MAPQPDLTVTLTNPRADRISRVRALSGRSVRLRTGRFLVEGPQCVREAVRFVPDDVVDVYMTPTTAERYPEIVEAASSAGLYLHVGTPEVLAAMSLDAQGVLAVCRTRSVELAFPSVEFGSPLRSEAPSIASVSARERASLSAQSASETKGNCETYRLVAILNNVRDPGNAGTVIRAADAAGADLVILAGNSVELHNPKLVRSTAGSLFHLNVVTGVALSDAVAALRAVGVQVLAADGAGEHDLDELQDVSDSVVRRLSPSRSEGVETPDLTAPTAWVFGNEAWGLCNSDRLLANAVVRVPIRGKAESLNLATAATVCLYASSRAQR